MMGGSRVSSRRQNGQTKVHGSPSSSKCKENHGESDGTSLCLIAAMYVLARSCKCFRVSLASDDGFTKKEYSKFVITGTIEVATCFPYIFLPTTLVVLAPWKSWFTYSSSVRIFKEAAILVVISYLILLDINLSFVWLFIFPIMAIAFIAALYSKFSPPTPASPNVAEKTNWKTREIKIILMVTLGALIVVAHLPDHEAEEFPISQFLLFLSSMVAALTRMLKKLPDSASLPGVARASEMLHKTLLLLVLLTAHTLSAELLGEDVVLICLLEVIPVLLWLSIHHNRKQGIVEQMKRYGNALVLLCAVVAPLIAYVAITKDEFGLYSSFLLAYAVSGVLTYYLACSLAMLN